MNIEERKKAFTGLGAYVSQMSDDLPSDWMSDIRAENPWFTEKSVKKALDGVAYMLRPDKLDIWLDRYHLASEEPRVVGIVMAGNIPLVGFHDLLCVLLSGHVAAVKLSSKDRFLMEKIIASLTDMAPSLRKNITAVDRLNHVDAVIATGSDNTARYFEYYFRKKPHVIRKNRTSVAVLNGKESSEELALLGDDIFSYFGLGCRNISKIYTPEGFDVREIFPFWEKYASSIHHNKYKNNYDYYKSIFLVNQDPHLDTGFLLVKSAEELVSPTSVLYHQTYINQETLKQHLNGEKEKIQCVVGHANIPFGQTQIPEPWDYADGVNVLAFLSQL